MNVMLMEEDNEIVALDVQVKFHSGRLATYRAWEGDAYEFVRVFAEGDKAVFQRLDLDDGAAVLVATNAVRWARIAPGQIRVRASQALGKLAQPSQQGHCQIIAYYQGDPEPEVFAVEPDTEELAFTGKRWQLVTGTAQNQQLVSDLQYYHPDNPSVEPFIDVEGGYTVLSPHRLECLEVPYAAIEGAGVAPEQVVQ